MKIEQSDFFVKKEFELGEMSLKCKEVSRFSSEETTIPYEQIDLNQKLKRSILPFYLKSIGFVGYLMLLGLIRNGIDWSEDSGVFWLLALSSLAIGWWGIASFKRNEILIFTSNGFIIVWEDFPDKEAVSGFMQSLEKAIKDCLISKYGKFDKDLPADAQIIGYAALKDRGIISVEEYEELKDQALGRKKRDQPIGFKK